MVGRVSFGPVGRGCVLLLRDALGGFVVAFRGGDVQCQLRRFNSELSLNLEIRRSRDGEGCIGIPEITSGPSVCIYARHSRYREMKNVHLIGQMAMESRETTLSCSGCTVANR